jgi:hypothetical protein
MKREVTGEVPSSDNLLNHSSAGVPIGQGGLTDQ